jgi:hypothetical protein
MQKQKRETNYYTQPHADGSYGVTSGMSAQERSTMSASPMSSWAKRIFTHEITINSQPRIVYRGRERKRQRVQNAITEAQ